MQRYCVYQDRCHQEVRNKLLGLGVYGDTLEQVIAQLIGDNFLNEERFACSYARGKFRMRQWGRRKILQGLKKHQISEYCIRKAMLEIEEDDYRKTLERVLEKKLPLTKAPNTYQRNSKLGVYAIGRGFEADLVWEMIKLLPK